MVSSVSSIIETRDNKSEASGQGVEMVTSGADDTERERVLRSSWGGLHYLLRALKVAYKAAFPLTEGPRALR